MAYKSPFFVVENFLTPLLCEEIVDEVAFPTPSVNEDTVNCSITSNEHYESIVYERFSRLIPSLEQYYNFLHKGTEVMKFEWIPEQSFIGVHAENAEFIEKKWVQTKARDFTCVVFLSDFNNSQDFDSDFECYGGNLEFMNHKFSIHPSRGNIVIFPSDPRFANATSKVLAGDAYQIRFHLAASVPFIYDPTQFAGDYTVWFK